jgi:hypothetical protein
MLTPATRVSRVCLILLSCCGFFLFAARPRAQTPLAVVPRCTVLAHVEFAGTSSVPYQPGTGLVLVAERTDPSAGSNFSPFRRVSGPIGNRATLADLNDSVFAMNEAWLRVPGAPSVFRGQATPALLQGADGFGSAWFIHAQDALGRWSGIETGTANKGNELDSAEVAALTVPQFMPVGVASPEIFACVGLRTEDKSARSTWLLKLKASDPVKGGSWSGTPVQDLLYGDSRFVPNAPGPLVGPSSPPVPSIAGPGDQAGTGSALCAMTQLNDDVSTRQLHMLAIRNGRLYHSLASDFGPVSQGFLSFERFRTISPWGDVGQVLGNTFGTIRSSAIVAHPTGISVFFYADAGNGRYKLWHAKRFPDGSWRAPDDVFLLSGNAATGTPYQMRVSAGNCPAFGAPTWNDTTNEILVALSGGSNPLQVLGIRVVTAPRSWRPGVTGIYSPWEWIPSGSLTGQYRLRNVVVSARPFTE